jgi:hypothetical protein
VDITTVNDRHLYRATVSLRDPADPVGRIDLPDRVVRFGPRGWLTVATDPGGDGIELYPTERVLAVSALREAGEV